MSIVQLSRSRWLRFVLQSAFAALACASALLWAPRAEARYLVHLGAAQSSTSIFRDQVCNLTEAIASINAGGGINGDCVDDGTGQAIALEANQGTPPVYKVAANTSITQTAGTVYINTPSEYPAIIESTGTVLTINQGVTVQMSDIIMQEQSGSNGRTMRNLGTLSTWFCEFRQGFVSASGWLCDATHTSGCGGGIYTSGPLTLQYTKVYYNSAVKGGGVYIAAGGRLTLDHATIGATNYYANAPGTGGNTASGDGGGIWNGESSGQGIDADHSTISYNTSSGKGGGIYAGVRTRVTTSTLAYNKAANGGGAYVGMIGADYVEMYATTVAYNTATTTGSGASQTGGGVYRLTGGNSECSDSLFTNNKRNNGATSSDYFGNADANLDTLYQCYFGTFLDTTQRSGFTLGNVGTLSNLSPTLTNNGGWVNTLAISSGPATGYPDGTKHRALLGGTDQTDITDPLIHKYDFGSYQFSWR